MNDYKVNNDELYQELSKYIEKTKINPDVQMSDKLGTMITKIVTGFSCRPSFNTYFFKDEMISLGIYYTCRYIKKYDLSNKNVHAYISKIAENAFMTVINAEKRKLYVKRKMQLNSDSIMNVDNTGNHSIIKGNAGDFQAIEAFVYEYEKSEKFKRKNKKI